MLKYTEELKEYYLSLGVQPILKSIDSNFKGTGHRFCADVFLVTVDQYGGIGKYRKKMHTIKVIDAALG